MSSQSPAQSRDTGRPKRLTETRSVAVDAPPETAFAPIGRIGGASGWYHADWLWTVRGLVDGLAGGVGNRRGRRHPVSLEVGDALDWWRVVELEPGRLLRLEAEMALPGRAWLQLEVTPQQNGSLITQRVEFEPSGPLGRLYWYAIWPLHALVFKGMLVRIARMAGAPLSRDRVQDEDEEIPNGVRGQRSR